MPSSDESFIRLHRAGWSIGDCRVVTPTGALWLVTGTNGENAFRANGRTQTEAWLRACEQRGREAYRATGEICLPWSPIG